LTVQLSPDALRSVFDRKRSEQAGEVWNPRSLTLSIHFDSCRGWPPPFDLSSRPERRDLRFTLVEKRNPEAIHPPHICLYPESETAGPSASLLMTNQRLVHGVLRIPLKPKTGLEWGHPNLRCRCRRQGHCSLNLPQASQFLGMTKGRVAITSAAVVGDGQSRSLSAT
jgi:hypothetical protein